MEEHHLTLHSRHRTTMHCATSCTGSLRWTTSWTAHLNALVVLCNDSCHFVQPLHGCVAGWAGREAFLHHCMALGAGGLGWAGLRQGGGDRGYGVAAARTVVDPRDITELVATAQATSWEEEEAVNSLTTHLLPRTAYTHTSCHLQRGALPYSMHQL